MLLLQHWDRGTLCAPTAPGPVGGKGVLPVLIATSGVPNLMPCFDVRALHRRRVFLLCVSGMTSSNAVQQLSQCVAGKQFQYFCRVLLQHVADTTISLHSVFPPLSLFGVVVKPMLQG